MVDTGKKFKTKQRDDEIQISEDPIADLDNIVVLRGIHMQPIKLPGSDMTCITMYLDDINGDKTKLYAFKPEMLTRIKDMIEQIENDL